MKLGAVARVAPLGLVAALLAASPAGCGKDDTVTSLAIVIAVPAMTPAIDMIRVRGVKLGPTQFGAGWPRDFPEPPRALGRSETLVLWFPDDAGDKLAIVEMVAMAGVRPVTAVETVEKKLTARRTVTATANLRSLMPQGDGGAMDPDAGPGPDGVVPSDRPGDVAPDAAPPRDTADAPPPPPDVPGPTPDVPPPCGNTGEACCAGSMCNGGNCCDNGRCLAPGSMCTMAGTTCAGGRCTMCGGPGQPCCNTNTCNDGGCCISDRCVARNAACMPGGPTCMAGSCMGCGAMGEPCCTGATCTAAGTVCNAGSGRCVACGSNTQPCCAGNECAPGHFCNGSMCLPCGGRGQTCCPNRTCNPMLCCTTVGNNCGVQGPLSCVL